MEQEENQLLKQNVTASHNDVNEARATINVLTAPLAVVGIGANLINLVVFWRQGLGDSSVNVSLFCLAFSDLLTLTLQAAQCLVVADQQFGFLGWPEELWFLGIWIIYGLALNSCCIAVFVSVERCLCIALPLKIKGILSPSRSLAILLVIWTFSLGSVTPILSAVVFIRSHDQTTNQSVVNIFLTRENSPRVVVTNTIVSSAQTIALICLIITTVVLIATLNRHSKWRQLHAQQHPRTTTTSSQAGSSSDDKAMTSSDSVSKKESDVVKLVVIVSSVLIACYSPGQIYTVVSSFVPEFNYGRRHGYLYRALWALAYFLYTLNSSMNIFIYYNMSSRYRTTLRVMLGWTSGGSVTSREAARRSVTSSGTR